MNTHKFAAALASKFSAFKPEWLRIPDAIKISGLSRSSIYDLITTEMVRSFCHKKSGATRGVRLISYDSLVKYLNAAAKAAQSNKKTSPPPKPISTIENLAKDGLLEPSPAPFCASLQS
jgi:hypothetical protein